MKNEFKSDYYRIIGKKWTFLEGIKNIIIKPELRFLYYCRHRQNNKLCYILKKFLGRKYGLEFNTDKIGKGLYIGHPFCITINDDAIIGKCCNIHKGVTIGEENRGKRKGSPIIGDFVWLGINSTIVGNIRIGNDVLIAPNSYVNCDIPAHSIVFGNPCIIKHRDNATEGYINRTI